MYNGLKRKLYLELRGLAGCVSFFPVGILLISLALCADAVIGNLQEKAMKQYSGSNLEMILYSYSIGEYTCTF